MQEIKSRAIEGSVAKILNEREVVINRGSEQGIRIGMKFSIMEGTSVIMDPDTRESLGSLTRENIRVKIVDVQPKFSVGRTYESYQARNPSQLIGLLNTLTTAKIRTIGQRKYGDIAPFSDVVGYIDVGDRVVQVLEE